MVLTVGETVIEGPSAISLPPHDSNHAHFAFVPKVPSIIFNVVDWPVMRTLSPTIDLGATLFTSLIIYNLSLDLLYR